MRIAILLALALAPPTAAAARPAVTSGAAADEIRAIERARLAALVNRDMDAARRLHAEDYQLIGPFGSVDDKTSYLASLASGRFRYVVWEPVGAIAVRRNGDSAIVRYLSRAIVEVRGRQLPESHYWHTDYYERRAGHWQVVWSQATEVRERAPPPAPAGPATRPDAPAGGAGSG